MRKILRRGILGLCFLCAAGAAWGAAHPFMDVPASHWAYDALARLAARGVLSGYPEGLYGGVRPLSRYELASALARALALADLEKASGQDIETLKKLALAFKDELDALGVRVEALDARIAVPEARLGGWRVTGQLRMDRETWDNDRANGNMILSRSRLEFHRRFGADESLYFYGRLESRSDTTARLNRFYVVFPFAGKTELTAGRFAWDLEADYRFGTGGVGDVSNASWFTDRAVDGLGLSREFSWGQARLYLARPSLNWSHVGERDGKLYKASVDTWEIAGKASFHVNERWVFDLGLHALLGDDASWTLMSNASEFDIDTAWTLWGGVQFDMTPSVAFRGVYYWQDKAVGRTLGALDDGGAFKVLIDVKQDFLKYTSLWLEYSRIGQGFFTPTGAPALYLLDNARWDKNGLAGVTPHEVGIWRVGARQRWNDRWSSWLYAAGHTLENAGLRDGAAVDASALQIGLGIDHRVNEHVGMSLNYIRIDWDGEGEAAGYKDEHRIQSRTSVVF